ncbi:hypothetical protein BK816_08115 [Boudabousia tangfeifanii]|uniref:GmrSD restriction endonucleases N-terminal domain-containing protein n=1 Tax=Boudabousia tangfeifanii TaxID=1912795 RepID=A0A1D9MM62_9ACTO|nr:DUF262 domain-containing protein [Boudabousia tangfeifanii]AOZ73253.1 hypothetical protein BK816_08115 [Boudabousia tangfeifanii]
MNVTTTSARGLFNNFRFVFPLYQREYSWEPEDVDDFLSSINLIIDRSKHSERRGDYQRLMGAIVLASVENSDNSNGVLEFNNEDEHSDSDHRMEVSIIDGQQRLTTIMMIASCLAKKAAELKRFLVARDIINPYISKVDSRAEEIVWSVRFSNVGANNWWYGHISSEFGKYRNDIELPEYESIESDSFTGPGYVTSSIEKMKKAISAVDNYFKNNVFDDDDSELTMSRIKDWLGALRYSIRFILWEEKDAADAFEIFEALNSKGQQLTTVDLLKMLTVGTAHKTEQEQVYNEWNNFIIAINGLGIRDSQIETFIRHIFISKHGPVSGKEVYFKFKEIYFNNSRDKKTRERFIDLLNASLDVYEFMWIKGADASLVQKALSWLVSDGEQGAEGGSKDESHVEYARIVLGACLRTLDEQVGLRILRPLFLCLARNISPETDPSAVKNVVMSAIGVYLRIVFKLAKGSSESNVVEIAVGNLCKEISDKSVINFATSQHLTSMRLHEVDPKEVLNELRGSNVYNVGVLNLLLRSVAFKTIFPPFEGNAIRVWQYGLEDASWSAFSSRPSYDPSLDFLGNNVLYYGIRRPRNTRSFEDVKIHYPEGIVDDTVVSFIVQNDEWNDDAIAKLSDYYVNEITQVWSKWF